MAACLSLVILLVLSLRVHLASGFEMMPEAQIRQQRERGDNSFGQILNMVMMGLPEDIIASISRRLQSLPNGGSFLNQPQATFGNQNTEASGANTVSNPFDSNDPIRLARKKRFSDFFGGYNNNVQSGFGYPSSGGNVPTNPNTGNFYDRNSNNYINFTDDFYRRPSSHFNRGFDDFFNIRCPEQVDQGAVYQYAADPSAYPAIDIANELLARSLPGSDLLFQCLSRQVVFPSDPPQIGLDAFLETANTTCRSQVQQLWSYQSVTFTGRCWPLVNFQETPFFERCLHRYCRCKNDDFFFNNKGNLCITEYETLSLWSYCESLLPNRRIVRDRIIVPDSCTCTTVQCRSGWHKK